MFLRVVSTCLAGCLFLLLPSQVALAETMNTTQPVPKTEQTSSAEQNNTETVSGPIQVEIKHSEKLQEKINITKDILPLRSNLKKRYSGYKISFQNNANVPIEIVSANVTMGTSGQQAYTTIKKGSKGAVAGILGGGLVVGLVTFGVGFALSLIAAPIVWGIRHSKNKNAQRESLPFNNQAPIGLINPGETLSFSTLVPFGTQAYMEATLKNPKTGELFVISQ